MRKKIDKNNLKKALAMAVEMIEKANENKKTRSSDCRELAAKHAEKAKELESDVALANARLTSIELDEDGGRINELRRTARAMAVRSLSEMEIARNYEEEARKLDNESQPSSLHVVRVDDNEDSEILTREEYFKELEHLGTWAGTRFYRNYTPAGYVPTRVTFSGRGVPYSYLIGTLEQLKEQAGLE